MRRLYTALLYLGAPLAFLHLAWRGLRNRGYWRRWGERLGHVPAVVPGSALVWVHAVSVGEVQAAAPLIRELLGRHPGLRVWVTTTTPTGSDRARALLGPRVLHSYAPYDLPAAVRRFLRRVRPVLAVFMETELWPNTIALCAAGAIPLVVANARLSERSARGYRRFGPLVRPMLQGVSAVAAQTEDDARRLVGIGVPAERVVVSGSLKFDLALPASLRERAEVLRRDWGADRGVWIAASTHEGEEEIVLAAHAEVLRQLPDTLLVLVPRHPERFSRVAALARRRGYATVLRSDGSVSASAAQVFVGDSMGELPLFYAACDVAFVGGSLVPVGGHNLLEPAALGLPVLSGAWVFNFAEVTRLLEARGAARRVRDARELAGEVVALLGDAGLRHAMGLRGQAVVDENRGALGRLLAILAPYLPGAT